MRSVQCNVEFGYQLRICSRTGKTTENVRWLAGRRTFRILITYFCQVSSSAFEYTTPNVGTYMCSCLV